MWAFALLAYDDDKCPGCGGQLTETTDIHTDGRWRVDPPTRCHRCTALGTAQDRYRETPHSHALLWNASPPS